MEDEIINKQWDNFYVKPNEADIEEVDSDTETEPDSKTKTSNLSSMISELYCPKENLEHVQKKRKISKSVRDRGLEAIKDVVETLPRDLPGELKYRSIYKKSFRSDREPIPVRLMNKTMSSKMYPDVPHEWACHGKLLMLTDPRYV